MKQVLDRSSTGRLMAYSAAAGMGAFAMGTGAQAAVQESTALLNTTFAHTGLASNGDDYTVDIDINGDGTNDTRLGVFLNAVSMTGFPGNAVLSDSTTGSLAYYVVGFQNGDTVDSSSDMAGGGLNFMFVTPYVPLYGGYRYQIFHTQNGDWVGVKFKIAGQTHFGAIQIKELAGLGSLDQTGDGDPHGVGDYSTDPVRVTLGLMVWEDQPDTGLVIPEPTSLALLAMGAGAIGLRRRAS